MFIIKLILSFLIGGLWVTVATGLADRHGTKVGGFIAGLPSTALLSLFFIGWTQSPIIAVQATTIIPAIGAVNALFLLVYISLVRKNFWGALGGSFLVWFGCSFTLIFLDFDKFLISIFIYIAVLFGCFFLIEQVLRVESKQPRPVNNTLKTLLCRGLFSGTIVLSAVLMGKIAGPLFGGMFAMFPAMFTGTLVITYLSHGPLFSSAMMKAALLSASSVVLYAILVRLTYIPFGLYSGTALSILGAFTYAFFIHAILGKKIS